ncbi:MAG TPA: hypothetical protein VIJ01_07895, partial [Candidatus Angelobacter sp.]
MSVKNNQLFSEFLLSVSEVSPKHFMEKGIPPNLVCLGFVERTVSMMMHSPARAAVRKQAGYFHRNGLLSQLMSVLLAWAMVMSSLPVYATDQPRPEWVHSLDVNSITKPTKELAQHRPAAPIATRPSIAKTVASSRLAPNPM